MTDRTWFSVLVGALLATGCGSPAEGETATAEAAISQRGVISRGEVAGRAEGWIARGIRYNWDKKTDGYRRDCSGYVSMSLAIPTDANGGPNTVSLRDHVSEIDRSHLKLGDIIGKIGPGTEGDKGHVLLFKQWVDSNTYEAYEMHGPTGTAVEVTRRPYPYDRERDRDADLYKPYRYSKISECPGYVSPGGACCPTDGTCRPGCGC